MAGRYYLVGPDFDPPFVLGLEARTREECDRAIRWQRVGQFMDKWCITVWDGAAFVCTETSRRLTPGRGCYTEQAWREFTARLRPRTPKELA